MEHIEKALEALTQRVENLERGRSKVSAGSAQATPLTFRSKYPGITQEIVNAVLSNPGLKGAATALNTTEKKLNLLLRESGIPHLYGEKWSVALKRAIAENPVEDTYTYPEEWFEKKEKIKEHAEKFKISETAKKLKAPVNVVGRFIQLHCS